MKYQSLNMEGKIVPIYEYQCQKCDKIITVYQAHNAVPVRVCPGCLGAMKRIMSKTTFRLKGEGWFSDPPKEPEREENDTK